MKKTNLEVISEAFENGGEFPVKYTGRGEEISPPLGFINITPEAKSITVIMDDPDTPLGTVTHWLLWNIPAKYTRIRADVPRESIVESLGGACQGRNVFRKTGYLGPKPPFGTHTYRIKVYVLDTFLDLKLKANKKQLEKAMEGHILQYGLLEGKFSR